jgi:hypothetical protein
LEQLRRLKTNGERKNVWSIFLILKPKYVEDLTLYLSDLKKKINENNQWKDSATQQVLTNRHYVHNATNNT